MAGNGARTARLRRHDPRQLGGYALLGRLGSGGMGVVYLGRSPSGEPVAVKVVHEELAEQAEFRARFRSEVARARQVPSFCTAEILDADVDNDPPYLVAEYVDGPSLDDAVHRDGPLAPANLHALALGVASALAAIHGAGVVHRDLKPSNVLLAPGCPKGIDFGIARASEAVGHHTRTDQMVGTFAYMAPERFDDDLGDVGSAADVFAWGAVVAYAGLGHVPFPGRSPAVMATRILSDRPELDGLPEPLRALVEGALEKNPADRPTARELLDLLLESDRAPTAVPGPYVPGAAAVPPRQRVAAVPPRQRVAAGPPRQRVAAGPPRQPVGVGPVAGLPMSHRAPRRAPGSGPAARGGHGTSHRVAPPPYVGRPIATQVVALALLMVGLVVGGTALALERHDASAAGGDRPDATAVGTTLPPEATAAAPVPLAVAGRRSTLRSELNGKCVDIPGADSVDGAAVQMWPCTGRTNQTWVFSADGTVRSLGRCLDGGSAAPGVPVRLVDCTGAVSQQWRYTDAQQLASPAADSCLDIADGDTADRARLRLSACTGAKRQSWLLSQ